jgi:hypothetical protein
LHPLAAALRVRLASAAELPQPREARGGCMLGALE